MSATEKKFYNLFWNNSVCQEIFSKHKAQLLEDEVELILSKEKYQAQRLVLTNSLERKVGSQALTRTENANIELIHNLQVAAKRYFDEEKIMALINHKFGQAIQKITEDLGKTGGWLKLIVKVVSSIDNEKDIFKLLSDYHLIPEGIENSTQFGNYCDREFTSHIKEFIKREDLSDLAMSIDLLSTYYNHKIKNNLFQSTKHYTDVLYDSENYKNRLDLFDDLFEIKVLNGGKLKGYIECVNCDPNTFNGIIATNIKPSKLKFKCPACSKETLYVVPYELDKAIYDHITDKDGLLFYAIKYLLTQKNIPFLENYTDFRDVELDICLTNGRNEISEIIEVKMFKTNRPMDTQVGNLREAISQVKKIVNKLAAIDSGFKNIKYSIITNIIAEQVYNQANKECKADLDSYNISLYSIADFFSKINN